MFGGNTNQNLLYSINNNYILNLFNKNIKSSELEETSRVKEEESTTKEESKTEIIKDDTSDTKKEEIPTTEIVSTTKEEQKTTKDNNLQSIEILIEGNKENEGKRELEETEENIKIFGDSFNELEKDNAFIYLDDKKIDFNKEISIKSSTTVRLVIKF